MKGVERNGCARRCGEATPLPFDDAEYRGCATASEPVVDSDAIATTLKELLTDAQSVTAASAASRAAAASAALALALLLLVL